MYYAKEEILLVISITPLAAIDITAAAAASSSSLSSIENGMDKKQDDNIKVSLYNANRERQTDSSGPTKPSATVTLTVSPRDLNARPAALPVPLAY